MKITFKDGPHGEVISASNSRFSYFSGKPSYLRDKTLKRNIFQGYARPDDWNDREPWPELSDSELVEVTAFWDALRSYEKKTMSIYEAEHEAAFLAASRRVDTLKEYPGGGSKIIPGIRGFEEGEE